MPSSASVGTAGASAGARLAADRQHAQLPVLGERQHGVNGDEHRLDMAADEVLHGAGRARIGHVLEIDLRRQLEQLHGEMLRRAAPGRGVGDLARLRLRGGDQLLHAISPRTEGCTASASAPVATSTIGVKLRTGS